MKLKETMGYNKHRLAKPGSTIAGYACHGFNYLVENGLVRPDEIDALLVVGSVMDYPIPPTSNVIQGLLGLREDCFVLTLRRHAQALRLASYRHS